jgi:hypothetical protein
MTDTCIDLSTGDGSVVVHPCREVSGEIHLPGDKSISHRAILFSLLSRGSGLVRGLSPSADVAASIQAVRVLGGQVSSVEGQTDVLVEGYLEGKGPLSAQVLEEQMPEALVNCQNSGTTMRLLTGVLAGRPGTWTLEGDESLSVRPMRRDRTLTHRNRAHQDRGGSTPGKHLPASGCKCPGEECIAVGRPGGLGTHYGEGTRGVSRPHGAHARVHECIYLFIDRWMER